MIDIWRLWIDSALLHGDDGRINSVHIEVVNREHMDRERRPQALRT